MAQKRESKQHLRVDNFSFPEDFRSRKRGPEIRVPLRNRAGHGSALASQYEEALHLAGEKSALIDRPISDDTGIYVELVSFANIELPLERLDTRDFELRACRKEEDREVAVIFIPDARRNSFQAKINQYLDQSKDGKHGPKNHILLDSIEIVRLAELKSFWTDTTESFPADLNQQIWWELWLKKEPNNGDPLGVAAQLSERLGLRLGNSHQVFFDTAVTLIYASVNQLQSATELISSLEELRLARQTPNFFVNSSAKEQREWIQNLSDRLELDADIKTSIVILDNGINYHHPLLAKLTDASLFECWQPGWPAYNDFANNHQQGWDHGSRQAGIAAFGDLYKPILSTGMIRINYRLESGRILPPNGVNDPELYGAITVGVSEKLEIERPDWNRIYSLAVTADPENSGGQPTSWSAEIDHYSSGFSDSSPRLFIISAGNIRDLSPNLDYWDQVQLAEVEDPAQSWNALTVGAFTEKTTNDDPAFDGWAPLAQSGDLSPVTRSSVNWRWRKQAPYKPDIVAEGGNRLISPDSTEITNADVVSLLTTSGRAAGQLFEVTGDTSAACALISSYSAILVAENPDYWPETIRGLLCHSAEWTPRMWTRFGQLNGHHSPKIAKEIMLRCVGYGVPDLDRARFSANHALTLVAQNALQPFNKEDEDSSGDPTLNEMCLYKLPWPVEELQKLNPDLEVKLRVTLSYFIEPNPGRRGYRQRFSYQSHGLRFEVIRPGQSEENFKASINKLATNDDYDGIEGDGEGWRLGPHLRARGSLHSDTWTGTAQALSDMHTIAVYPVGGWWKFRKAEDRWRNSVRFSLIVSIDVPDTEVDIYSTVETQIQTAIEIDSM